MRVNGFAAACAALCFAGSLRAQQTEAPQDSTLDMGWLSDDDHGGITITSGKTYNRVEGLPILLGPTYKGSIGRGDLTISALGILRTAHGFHWDAENVGHRLNADLKVGRKRGFAVGISSFDIVEKIEPWHLTEPDGALAAFFTRRDYFDHFGRHGARAYASIFRSDEASVSLGYSRERWSSRRARDVFTLFREDETWRTNPRINDGLVHLLDLNADLDTRNNPDDPRGGWFISAKYEYGSGEFQTEGARIVSPVDGPIVDLKYGRAFLDLRRYNRISPKRQLNARLVVGGWLHGDQLPLERRLSVGGLGTLPGFDFRRLGIGTDVGQCSPDGNPLPGRPAECERIALAQLEYRHELVSELFDVFNRNGIRVRGAVFRVKPSAVVFADAGRGWIVGAGQENLRYSAWSLPGFDTFRTDVGIGLDLGIAGIYVAKAVSAGEEPANVFIRFRNRF
ncbi:MAG: BamA/TamA family outer membrane protein [Gemmatimonadales bacterium]